MATPQRRIEVGEDGIPSLRAAGIEHAVIEVVRQTDGSGNVSFAEPGISLALQLTPTRTLANVNTGLSEGDAGWDPFFGAMVIECYGDHAGKYLVAAQHPELARIVVAPGAPQAVIDETITFDWEPGTITIEDGGVPQAGKRCSITFRRQTADGVVEYELGANKAAVLNADGTWSAGRTGRWITDGSGELKDKIEGESLEDLSFSMYPGGQTDLPTAREWAGAPRQDEEHMIEITVWCEGVPLRIGPGVGGTIEIGAGSISCTGGTVGATINASLEHCEGSLPMPGGFGSAVLDGAGAGTITGLAAGRYCLEYFTAGDYTTIGARQWVDVERGQTTAVSLSALETPTNDRLFYVWSAGGDPISGAEIIDWILGTVAATTDANGRADFTSTATRFAVNHGTWGYQEIRDVGTHPCRHVCLGGYAAIVSGRPAGRRRDHVVARCGGGG